MAEEQPSLHIDTDWKKRAQEEKRKLAEQSAKAKTSAASGPIVPAAGVSASPAAAPATGRRAARALPAPGFGSLVQSVMTQILYYLGELPSAAGQTAVDLDLAKHHLDTLSMLEDKTKNNLSLEEQSLLDGALYETRTRFVNVASQFLGP